MQRLNRLLISVLSALFVASTIPVYAASTQEQILRRVDDAISKSDAYQRDKLANIERLKARPALSSSDKMTQYEYNRELFRQYESLVCDSALHYISANVELAKEMNRDDLYAESVISKALVFAKAGLFHEALELLPTVNTKGLRRDLLRQYYMCISDLYQFMMEYEGGGEYLDHYKALTKQYKDSVLAVSDENSYEYVLNRSSLLLNDEKFEEGTRYLRPYLDNYKIGTREYAVLSSILAYGYRCLGDHDNEILYYANAAISDIEGVVKENMALRALSEIVFANGDYDRANRYIRKSVADANYFSARMRKNQSALMLPIMTETFQAAEVRQRHELTILLIIAGVLAVGFVFASAFSIRQLRKVKHSHRGLSQAKDQLQQVNAELTATNVAFQKANRELSESNSIKEEYLGRFLSLCSKYLSMLEQYRKNLYQLAVAGKTDELHRALKSMKVINETISDFYTGFDTAFLSIFPNFVSSVNALLPEDDAISLKYGEKLNTELRILALVRLGITDSTKIAEFLRCSITTIYTYRSKLKKRSIDGDSFEAKVMEIPSV